MKDQSEPQPPSDDSNGEEPVFIPPLFMALLHPEDYPQSVFIKALRPLWRSSTYQKILEEGRAEVRRGSARDAPRKRGDFSGDKEPGDLESPTPTSRPRLTPSRIWSDSSSCPTGSSR